MKSLKFAFLIALATTANSALAEVGLKNCADQFPAGSVKNAPTRNGSQPGVPSIGNIHLCERSGSTSFFALEYNPARLIPDWVAFRLQDNFGAKKCSSMPRNNMQCYFKRDDAAGCVAQGEKTDKWPGDPFHADDELKSRHMANLGIGAFSGTKHDRGHLAPNNAFSWHICGTYKTFTMANMAPQRDVFNRNVWQQLEEAALYWGVTNGPIYEATGPIYGPFPYAEFKNFDPKKTVKPGQLLKPSPAEPRIVRPTGFFKVLYKPAKGVSDRDRAVAFLIPHSYEKKLDFRNFVASVSLVEQASGLRFGFGDALKNGDGWDYWLDHLPPGGWSVRPSKNEIEEACPNGFSPPGWYPKLKRADRIKLCASDEYNPPVQ